MSTFVGIDLGTTFSVVAYINKDGRPEVIRNEYSDATTPSVVYLGPGGPLVGREAKDKQGMGDESVASFFKRSMGDQNFELAIEGKAYTPVDLSVYILEYLKETAEKQIGEQVTHAVITVPAYFNNLQRQATIEAGKRSGLNVLSIISEPTAAALAFGMRPSQADQRILVYDLGGGTFDVSIVEITATEQRVIGTGGDHNLGGKDWDDRIFNYLATKFQDEFGVELGSDDFNTLLVKSENLKKGLSARISVDVQIQAGQYIGNYTLTRDLFESLTSDLMERTQRLTEQTLEDVNLKWRDLDAVLLVGGSTRMPMVKSYVERMSGKPPLATVNPDEAVALGATIQAAMDMELLMPQKPLLALAGRKKSTDVMSHSLGMIAINEDNTKYINSIIIRKNQPIPSTETRPFTLAVNKNRETRLEVYMTQGESTNPMDCAYLGRYVFSNFPSIPDKKALIDICYAYDRNGVVNLSAVERSSGSQLALTIETLPDDVPYRFSQPPAQIPSFEHLTVYLAFDLSGSMGGQPLSAAQKAAHAFVTQLDLSSASVGLISFSDSLNVEAVASQNVKQISRAIDGLEIGRTGYGNATHPFDSIFKLLEKASGLRYGIVLADGMWENQSQAIARAKKCHAAGIEIIGIGFGGADKAFLKAISSRDENSIFTDISSLTETFSTIAQELTEGGLAKGRGPGLRARS